MARKKKVKPFDIFLHGFFIVLMVISIFPIWLIVANAFSKESDIVNFGYAVFPMNFTFDAFKFILQDASQLLSSLWATVVHAFGSSILSITIQVMLGYALSRPEFALKKVCTVMLTITMFFQAGLIPEYIVRTQIYHLDNSWFIYLVPAVSGFSVFVFRSFFNQVPKELTESATLDGATHLQVLWRISLPLSMTFVGTQFFMSVSVLWKNFTTSMYYISDPKMYTLEHYIQLIAKDAALMKQSLMEMGVAASEIPTETMRFATVFFTLIPMLLIFPFFQRYFTKGLMVGSVKG